jgi:hypothetical protein
MPNASLLLRSTVRCVVKALHWALKSLQVASFLSIVTFT